MRIVLDLCNLTTNDEIIKKSFWLQDLFRSTLDESNTDKRHSEDEECYFQHDDLL